MINNKKSIISIFIITILISMFIINIEADDGKNKRNIVYICLDKGDNIYHDHACWILKQCKSEVKPIYEDEAVDLKRSPCKVCYHDDYYYPYKPGEDDGIGSDKDKKKDDNDDDEDEDDDDD